MINFLAFNSEFTAKLIMEKDKKYSNEALLMNIIFAFRAILRSILFCFCFYMTEVWENISTKLIMTIKAKKKRYNLNKTFSEKA